jgi:hypothetical protein
VKGKGLTLQSTVSINFLVEFYPQAFLTAGNRWKWMISSTPGVLIPWERTHGAHCMGGWVDLRADLEALESRKASPSPEIGSL